VDTALAMTMSRRRVQTMWLKRKRLANGSYSMRQIYPPTRKENTIDRVDVLAEDYIHINLCFEASVF
jgi:hypothetical protein